MTPSDPAFAAPPALTPLQAALCAVSAAAALRSPNALWLAVDEALALGATADALEEAIMAAVRVAAEAVQRDAAPTISEVRARWGARQRWNIADNE